MTENQKPHIWDADQFFNMWELWRYKGHDPIEKLTSWVFKQPDGSVMFAVGIWDYVSFEEVIFPCAGPYKNREQAFAAVGRALKKLQPNVE